MSRVSHFFRTHELLDIRKHRLMWSMPLVILLVWHVTDTIFRLGWQYLFFVCYTANVLLCIGLLRRSSLLIGVGFGWLVIAFPLWLYDAILTSNWELSCTLFHIIGLPIGVVAFFSYRLPFLTPVAAVGIAMLLHVLARLFTDEALNINSAFRVYNGWETVYPNYILFYLISLIGFSGVFAVLTWLNNRLLPVERLSDEV